MNKNTRFIPFAHPQLGRKEERAVLSVLRSGWLTTGPYVSLFEKNFKEMVGVNHAIAVNSATAGLHLALDAIGIKAGDYVITSPFTFTSTAEVIRYMGAHPLFVDIEEETWNIDPEKILLCLKNNKDKPIKAIIPIHLGGIPCKMEEINRIAKEWNLRVIEDSAHCFPVKTAQGYAGTLSDIGVYSFYANKTITTGEGGMVVTNDPKIAERIKLMRLHGIDRDVWNRYTEKKASWIYDIIDSGYKYNMTDIAAAIGVEQLKKAKKLKVQRALVAQKYNNAFKDIPGITIPPLSPGQAWHLYILQIDKPLAGIDRDQTASELTEKGIGISMHYIPLHLMTYYRKLYYLEPEDFPVCYKKYLKGISLPIYPGMKKRDIKRVIESIYEVIPSARKM